MPLPAAEPQRSLRGQPMQTGKRAPRLQLAKVFSLVWAQEASPSSHVDGSLSRQSRRRGDDHGSVQSNSLNGMGRNGAMTRIRTQSSHIGLCTSLKTFGNGLVSFRLIVLKESGLKSGCRPDPIFVASAKHSHDG